MNTKFRSTRCPVCGNNTLLILGPFGRYFFKTHRYTEHPMAHECVASGETEDVANSLAVNQPKNC